MNEEPVIPIWNPPPRPTRPEDVDKGRLVYRNGHRGVVETVVDGWTVFVPVTLTDDDR
jgi:hypothetical protein